MRHLKTYATRTTYSGAILVAFFILYFCAFVVYERSMYIHWNLPWGNIGFISQESLAATTWKGMFSAGGLPFWSTDASFSLVLIGPLVAAFGITVFFILSPAIIIFTAFLIHRFSLRQGLAFWEALLLTASFLLSPLIISQAAWGFDPIMFAMLLWTYFFVRLDDPARLPSLLSNVLLAVVALLSKNESALIGVGIGLWLLLFSRRHIRLGALTLALSLAWFIFVEAILLPSVHHGVDPIAQTAWGYMGNGIMAKLSFVATHPMSVVLAIMHNLPYLFRVIGPLLPFSLISPLGIVVSMPTLLPNILSHWSMSTVVYDEYTYFTLPFIYLSLAYALSFLRRLSTEHRPRILGILYVTVFGLISIYPGYLMLRQWALGRAPSSVSNALTSTLSRVPRQSLLIVPNAFGGRVYRYPYVQVTWGGVSGLLSAISQYSGQTGLRNVPLYYMNSSLIHANESAIKFLVAIPDCRLIVHNRGAFLLSCRVNVGHLNSLHSITDIAMFQRFDAATAKYLHAHGNPQDLSPLTLEDAGLLSPMFGGYARAQPNWNWTFTGGWIGPWTGGEAAIGLTTNSKTVQRLADLYKGSVKQILFPYPKPWTPTMPSRQNGFAMFVFSH